ncbi:MAG: beta-propeller domain-containing protein [Oscillospiraceae bacterium]|nr:beta-propeller domain-containing protein [Oscillospiraceae bacterium]
MTFDEKLNELISEVEVPDELSPQNIALMLKAKNAQSKMEAEHRNIKAAPSIAAQRRIIITRTAAAVAACAVFATAAIAFGRNNDDVGQIEDQIDYNAVSPESYDDLYNIYTGIYLGGTAPEEEEQTGTETAPAGDEDPVISDAEAAPREMLSELSAYDFSGAADSRVSEADIVKSDGTNLYCIAEGKLYIVSLETMEVVAEVENDLNPPVELYIEGDTLILVSKENEEVLVTDSSEAAKDALGPQSDSSQTAPDVPAEAAGTHSNADSSSYSGSEAGKVNRTNVVVDFYNISDKTNPVRTASYKQNGRYTSSKIVGGVLYTVTGYSDYRTAPLDKEADLDSYVPAYFINGNKHYVAAEDITVPSNANSTDYTVVSAIDLGSLSELNATVKAVLGSSRNVYCSADTLYIVGVGKSKDNSDYSIVTSFDLSDESGISYKASGSIAGKVIGRCSMNEYNGLFRIASEITDENGTTSVSLYVLDETLTAVNSAGQLLSGEKVSAVRFEENYASLYTDSSEPALVIDLASDPPVQAQSLAGASAYLYSYSEDKLLGLGVKEDGSALTLTMYSAENGLMYHTVSFAEGLDNINSKALKDRRAILIDSENGIIGVPVYSHTEFGTKNQYCVFEYDEENGFISKGTIEYNDLDDEKVFERAAAENGMLYISGGSRVVSVQLSDLKVVNVIEF